MVSNKSIGQLLRLNVQYWITGGGSNRRIARQPIQGGAVWAVVSMTAVNQMLQRGLHCKEFLVPRCPLQPRVKGVVAVELRNAARRTDARCTTATVGPREVGCQRLGESDATCNDRGRNFSFL